MEYRTNKNWWDEFLIDVSKYKKDDILKNVKAYYSISLDDDITYIPTGRNAHRSLSDIIIEHYRKAFGLHVQCRNEDIGTRRHPWMATRLDCHIVELPKWMRKNEDGTYDITNVQAYLTACNNMIKNVCVDCARNHLNASKLFDEYHYSPNGCSVYAEELSAPFGIDCERDIQRREEERKAQAALMKTCDDMCEEKLKKTIDGAEEICSTIKKCISTANVVEKVFYWDSYSRQDGYQIELHISDDVVVSINALARKDYSNHNARIVSYELSDVLYVSTKYGGYESCCTEYNALRKYIINDERLINDIRIKMDISKFDIVYPEEESRYINKKRWWSQESR